MATHNEIPSFEVDVRLVIRCSVSVVVERDVLDSPARRGRDVGPENHIERGIPRSWHCSQADRGSRWGSAHRNRHLVGVCLSPRTLHSQCGHVRAGRIVGVQHRHSDVRPCVQARTIPKVQREAHDLPARAGQVKLNAEWSHPGSGVGHKHGVQGREQPAAAPQERGHHQHKGGTPYQSYLEHTDLLEHRLA